MESRKLKRREFIKSSTAAILSVAVRPLIGKEKLKKEKEWKSIYEKGNRIKLVPDEKFNQNFEEGEKIFKSGAFDIDEKSGKIFFSDRKRHGIHVFNRKGKFEKTFGQLGEGNGDLRYPKVIGVFKDKLWVQSYYGATKISEFDLNGKIKKEFKLDKRFVNVYPLNGNNFYYYQKYIKKDKKISLGWQNGEQLNEKNSFIKKSLEISAGKNRRPFRIIPKKYYFEGSFSVAKGKDFVVFSNSDEDFIYHASEKGEIIKIPVFSEKDKKKPTKELIKKREEELLSQINPDRYKKLNKAEINYAKKEAKRLLKKNRKDQLPYYNEMKVDSEGNILFINQDEQKLLVYKMSKDKKSLSKIAELGEDNDLTKKVCSGRRVHFGKNGTLFGFWEDEEGEMVFKKFNIKLPN